jgi:hypothetical protein
LGFIRQTFKRGGISVEGPVPACRFSADPFFAFRVLFFGFFSVSLIAEGPDRTDLGSDVPQVRSLVGLGVVATPSEKRVWVASTALRAAFQRANLGLTSSTLNPAAVASRVGTVDDDFRISRVIENPEVMRPF